MKKKREKKVFYSLFSFRAAVGIFVGIALSVLYTLAVFARVFTRLSDRTSIDYWMIGSAVFLFLCLIYTLIILLYRKIIIKTPVLKILDATEKIGEGDFSARLPIKPNKRFLTEYDIMAQNINKMSEELSSIETLRQDFVSNVSHEFKIPLAVMQNSCTIIMQDDLSEEDRKKYTKNIYEASKRMSSMITNILKLNKIESKKIVTKDDKINLAELIREEILLFESIWESKNIDIEVDADESIYINSDIELLSLMFGNLLSNAFKFTPDGGKVTACVKHENGSILISVADTGPGIPNDKKDRIFEKFYQIDTSHVTEGNGLGLALVNSICDILGYSISVESEFGKGCCFKIKI